MKVPKQVVVLFLIIMVGLTAISGCQFFRRNKTDEKTVTPAAPLATGSIPIYYDFKDVLIPGKLKLDPERRSVYTDARVVSGVLFFKGRIEARSLAAFFKEKMPQDDWRLINTFWHQRKYQMNFQKEGALCQITIYDHLFNTEVEVRRTPILPLSEPMLKGTATEPVSPAPPVKKKGTSKSQPIQIQPIK